MSNSSFTWKIHSALTSGHQLFLDTCRKEVITAFQGSLFSISTHLSMQGDGRRVWTWVPLLTLLPGSWDTRASVIVYLGLSFLWLWSGRGRDCVSDGAPSSLGFLEGSSGAAKKVEMGVKCWQGHSHAKRELLWFCILCFWLWINDFYK